jgi:hypothetical protein
MNWSAFAQSPSNSVGALPMRWASWFAGGMGGATGLGGLGAPGFPGLPPPPPGLLLPPPGLLLGCHFIAVSSFFCMEATILGLVVVVVVVVAMVVAMVCSCISVANGRVAMSGECLMMMLVRSSVSSLSVVGELGCWSVETGDGGRTLSCSLSESGGIGRNIPPSSLCQCLSTAFSLLCASMSGLLGPCTSLNLSPSSLR